MRYVYLAIVMVLVIMPILLHGDSYRVINEDTMWHLKAFDNMEVNGYNGLYGGQVVAGYIVNHLPFEKTLTFMVINFLSLFIAGISVGFMVYRLSGSEYAGLLSIPVVIFAGATMHLFFSGTIFNLINVLIVFPWVITLYHWLAKNKHYIIAGIVSIPIGAFTIYFHPSLGKGIIFSGELKEAVLNPIESLFMYVGAVNIIMLITAAALLIKNKVNMKWYDITVIVGISAIIITTAVIGYYGLNPFPSRVIINMSMFIVMLTMLLVGYAITNKTRWWFTGLATLSVAPSIIYWINYAVIKGMAGSEILS